MTLTEQIIAAIQERAAEIDAHPYGELEIKWHEGVAKHLKISGNHLLGLQPEDMWRGVGEKKANRP